MSSVPPRAHGPISRAEALAWLSSRFPQRSPEPVELQHAVGRVLAETVPPVVHLRSAAIDGLALLAATTEGASDYTPLQVAGTAVVAGAPLPAGTDAVLPLQSFEHGCALVSIAPGHGIAEPDTAPIASGTVLRPLHLAALAMRGRAEALVHRQPRVALRVAGAKTGPDALTPMLQAMVDAAGGRVDAIAPDLILLAGRSGPGPDDRAIDAFSRVIAHGISIQPGETAAIGDVDGTPALLLPGDPMASAVAFLLLAAPTLRRLAGRPDPAATTGRLTRKIVSSLGQLDAVPVRLASGEATPLPPLLSAFAAADGLVLVPEGSEGYPAGAAVAIYPLSCPLS